MEKLERNDLKINLFIQLKQAATKKIKVNNMGIFTWRIFVRAPASKIDITS